jgi:acetylornithine deacetylase
MTALAETRHDPGVTPSAEAIAMIDRLIAFPTVSRDSNLGLIEFARDHLAALGVRPRLAYDASRKKASLFCSLADDAGIDALYCDHVDRLVATVAESF